MKNKVWVIGDPELDTVPMKAYSGEQDTKNQGDNAAVVDGPQRNPAVSFSLSMLVWGGGHMFIRQWRPGLIYLAAMVLFYGSLGGAAIYHGWLARFLSGRPGYMIGVLGLFLCGLLAWIFSAVDAYYRTLRSRTEPFLGVERKMWACGGSLLFPGWGQFLNSQSRKGIFFLCFGVAGLFSVFALVFLAEIWPLLPWDRNLYVYERWFIGLLLFVPVAITVWIVSIYDAFRSCENFLRYRQKSKLDGKRFRGKKNFLRDLVPQTSTVLAFLLAISLGMQFFPKEQYLNILTRVQIEMVNSHMTILPHWLQKAIEFMG